MFQILVELQRTIYLAVGEQIRLLSVGGDWLAFMGFLPMGIVFGAAHALTPGHSKAVLATYLAGSDAKDLGIAGPAHVFATSGPPIEMTIRSPRAILRSEANKGASVPHDACGARPKREQNP
jgi:hypothetical protein